MGKKRVVQAMPVFRRPFVQLCIQPDRYIKNNKTDNGRIEVIADGKVVIATGALGDNGRVAGAMKGARALLSFFGVRPQVITTKIRRPSRGDFHPGLLLNQTKVKKRWQLFIRWDNETRDKGLIKEMKNTVELTLNKKVVVSIPNLGVGEADGCCQMIVIILHGCNEDADLPMCIKDYQIRPNYHRED